MALASTKLLLDSDWESRIKWIDAKLNELLLPAKNYSNVNDLRILGAIGVIDCNEPGHLASFQS